jgi:hypothetical protein
MKKSIRPLVGTAVADALLLGPQMREASQMGG